MRTRTALVSALVAVTAAGSVAPAVAAKPKPKPKPKPIVETYTATATPDPTSTSQVTNEQCVPTIPSGIHHHTFKIPAAGTLEVVLGNQLDWSLALRDGAGTLTSSDGDTPDAQERTSYPFSKKGTVTIDTCNFAGEPSIPVTATFTYR